MEGEVIECRILRFCRPIMQKTAYELWLKDQKKVLHLKCARFLEESAHRCNHCRNRDFIPYHHFIVDIRLNTLDMHTVKKMAKSQGFKSKIYFTSNQSQLVLGSPGESNLYGLGQDLKAFNTPGVWDTSHVIGSWGREELAMHKEWQSPSHCDFHTELWQMSSCSEIKMSHSKGWSPVRWHVGLP